MDIAISNPQDHIKIYNKKTIKNVNRPILELPFISDRISNQIGSYTRKLEFQAHIIFKPGKKLRGQFCNSTPRDSWRCVVTDNKECTICPNHTCSAKNLVCEITCELCHKRYIGETERSLHNRMLEHRRAASATHPEKYQDNALAKHYSTEHKSLSPSLKYRVLKSHLGQGNDVVLRPKISKIVINRIPLLMYSVRVPETPLLLFAFESMEIVVFWATPIWTVGKS